MRRAATAYRPHGQPAPIRAVGAGPRPLAAAVLHGACADCGRTGMKGAAR